MCDAVSPVTLVSDTWEWVRLIWLGSVSMDALISSSVAMTMSTRGSTARMVTPKARGSCHWSGRKSMSSTTSVPTCWASSAANMVALRLGSLLRLVPANWSTLLSATGAASTSSMVNSMSAQLSR